MDAGYDITMGVHSKRIGFWVLEFKMQAVKLLAGRNVCCL